MLTYYLFRYTSEPYVLIPLIVLGIIFFFKYDSIDTYIPLILTITTLVYFFGYHEYYLYHTQKNNKKNASDMPYISECPDYWDIVGKNKCKRIHKTGLPNCSPEGHSKMSDNIVNFDKSMYLGKEGNQKKCQWAKECKVSWEGIDNLCN